jgi:phosphoribosylformylglycinamidine synthase PurS subunit
VRWRVRLVVMPLDGLRSPEGETVEHALAALGFAGVHAVSVGKLYEYLTEAADGEAARAQAQAMADALLANPVSERAAVLDVTEAPA